MGRPGRRGIEAESIVTVHSDCDISCEVVGDDQIEFWFGPVTDGLHLYFDRPGFAKFMCVVDEMRVRTAAMPSVEQMPFTVHADERSRQVHRPKF
jgi:hypothetical protein